MIRIFYIVSSVKMVIELIKIIDSDFFARVISRGFILRIEDFIKLLRRYNNSQISNKNLNKELKKKLNNLDKEFFESLKVQRDKYGGHIQDLNFKDRINLWQGINKEKILFFYNEIINIYGLLKYEKDYIEIKENQFIIEEKNLENIKVVLSKHNIENKFYMSYDILSITRGCNGLIPCHPIQDKMATIKAIELMINFEIDLYYALISDENYSLLLKTLIITDLISYIDNIKHRKESQDIGITYLFEKDIFPLISFSFSIVKPSNNFLLKKNSLIKTYSQSKVPLSIIVNFIENYKLTSVEEIRNIRNKIGAHIDNNITEIKEFCESKNFKIVIKTYQDFKNLIKKVCHSKLYLRIFAIEPTLMNGITRINNDDGYKNNTFFGKPIIKEYDETRHLFKNDCLKYKEYIDSIVNEDSFTSSISFFYEAFLNSDIQETLKYENYELKIRKIHGYFIKSLNSDKTDLNTKKIMLRIMESCSSGSPRELVYILLETYESNKEYLLIEYTKSFSSIGSYHMFDKVYKILVNNISFSDCYIRFLSISALLNIDINARGIDCINKKLKINKNKYVEIIHLSLNQLNPFCKVVLSILLMSQLKFPSENSYLKFFKEIYYDFFQIIFIGGLSSLNINFTDEELNNIEESNAQCFFTKSLLIIAEKLKDEKLSNFIYNVIVANELKINEQYTPFLEHRAYCYYKLNNIGESIKIYEYLADANPDYVEFSLTLIDYLYEKNEMKKIQELIYFIEERYSLSEENLKRFNQLKNKLVK